MPYRSRKKRQAYFQRYFQEHKAVIQATRQQPQQVAKRRAWAKQR